jgi:hypothetical protein
MRSPPHVTSGDDSIDDRSTPDSASMLSAALACAAAADSYVAADRWYSPGPVLMLLGRSFELGLKAYALHTGATADALRYRLGGDLDVNLRHGLDNALEVADGVSEREWSALRDLDRVLKAMRTAYPDAGGRDLPGASELRRLLERVLAACCAAVRGPEPDEPARGELRGLRPDPRALYRAAEPAERGAPRQHSGEQSD